MGASDRYGNDARPRPPVPRGPAAPRVRLGHRRSAGRRPVRPDRTAPEAAAWRPTAASGSQPSPPMMPRMRVASASRAKGFVITCMPGPRWPWLRAAFSA